MKPITRREALFSRLAGEAAPTGEPVTREERLLAALLAGDEALPEAVTRRERFLSALRGGERLPEPVTRRERFFAAAAGYGRAPTPVTREETLLAALAQEQKTTEAMPLARVTDAVGGVAMLTVTLPPRIAEGGAVPYETVRITRAGRNLFDPFATRFTPGQAVTQSGVRLTLLSDGRFRLASEASARTDFTLFAATAPLQLPAGRYTFSLRGNEEAASAVHLCTGGAGAAYNGAGYFDVPQRATVEVLRGELPWSYCFLRVFAGHTFDLALSVQIEAGEAMTDYAPYDGETQTLALPEAFFGGTVTLAGDGTARAVCRYGEDGAALPAPWEQAIKAQPLRLRPGENAVYASAGTVELTYARRR